MAVLIQHSCDAQPTVVVQGTDPTVVIQPQLSRTVEVITAGPQGPTGPSGPPGPAGGNVIALPAATALGGHRVVRSTGDGRCGYASADNPLHGDDVLGITLGAAVAGANANVQVAGEVTEPSWAWTPQEPVFLGANGVLTQEPPTEPDAAFVLIVGFATSPTGLMLRIEGPIYFED